MAATHKTLLILTYALLEWILILMLLLNSFFSYLIRKFATHYRLKPPCLCCSTLDHLLGPNNKIINPYPDLICKTHATQIHMNLYEGRNDEVMDVVPVDENIKSSGHIQVFDQIIPLEWTDSSTSCSTTTSNRHQIMVFDEQDHLQKQDGIFLKLPDCQDEEDKAGLSIDSLMAELRSERLAVCGLYIELDEERNASTIAAKHAMDTITRLEEEKVALQIEFMHNQRMMNEQAEYDQEVVQLLNELVMKLESDKAELENEVEMYKKKLLDSCSSGKECLHDEADHVLDLKNLRRVDEESVWIVDEIKDLIRKASLDGEDVSYKGNRLFHLLDHVEGMYMNEEDDEASHSPWRQGETSSVN